MRESYIGAPGRANRHVTYPGDRAIEIRGVSLYHTPYHLRWTLPQVAETMNAGKNATSRAKETSQVRKIKDLRSKLGLTEEQFATKVGVPFSTAGKTAGALSHPSAYDIPQN